MDALGRRVVWLLVMLTGTAGMVPAVHAEREMLAGHWRLLFYGACVNTPRNADACRTLQAPANFAVIGVPGASLTVRGVGEYQADARGRYTVHFVTTVTERVPGAGAPVHCSNTLVFDGRFNGTCREEGTGHGHIARGKTGMPDFWQDDAQGWWDGSPRVHFTASTTTDTFNPACPGTYDAARFLRLFGFRKIPAGITARLVLTHR